VEQRGFTGATAWEGWASRWLGLTRTPHPLLAGRAGDARDPWEPAVEWLERQSLSMSTGLSLDWLRTLRGRGLGCVQFLRFLFLGLWVRDLTFEKWSSLEYTQPNVR
jgi:hypothetical protein